MYSVLNDRPLSPVTLAILKNLKQVAEEQGAGYFVIGATARDILMTHVFGIDAGRATRDVDFAIALEDWAQFETLKARFVGLGDFHPAASHAHRLYYRQNEYGAAYPIDLIPFGRIERSGSVIAWPPDMQVVMNVAGYAEALQTALPVDVGDGVIANVVSIPALAALKLLAWNDRGLEDNKDAQDFYFLLKNYHLAGNADRLYEEAMSVLISSEFELDAAGATLLGYDSRMILENSTRQALLDVIGNPIKRDRLVLHMDRSIEVDATTPSRFLEQFERGLNMQSL